MNGKTHIFGGVCAGIVCADTLLNHSLNIETLTIGTGIISASYLGSILCDIDSETSIISKKIPIISFVLNLFVKHRGLMHTYIPYIAMILGLGIPTFLLSLFLTGITNIFSYSIFAIYIMLSIGFLAGITSHLILDMITTEGVAILYPIYKKKISIAKLTEKKNSHKFLVRVLCLSFVCFILYKNHNATGDIIDQFFIIIKTNIDNFYHLITTSGNLIKKQ